jgi:glucosamine-phosphate N-acetyltransferase
MIFRELYKSDYEEYIKLINDFRPINSHITKETFENIYDIIFKNSIIFVIEIDNKIVASGKLLIEQKFIHNLAKYGYIEDIIVSEKNRNKGLGKKIVKYIVDYCKVNKFYKITLTCDEKLINFYKKNNFEVYQIHMSQLI